jgi:peptide/nickel transport system permease protein
MSFLRYLLLRLLLVPATLLVVTAVLYGMLMFTPAPLRAMLYLSSREQEDAKWLPLEDLWALTEPHIQSHHLDDPYPVQYAYWLLSLVQEGGGYSPSLRGEVFAALLRRTAVTAELTLYSLLFFIPLGLLAGARAGWWHNQGVDLRFRLAAFVAASLPPFILALVLLSIFYVGLGWFPAGRLSGAISQVIIGKDFHTYTGLVTIDGLLNGRWDVSLDALRHLVLPVITLGLLHWATLGRIMRSMMIEEKRKQYLIAARARGLPENSLLWRHAFRNALAPALASTALSIATLFTGVFMIETIYSLKGVADLVLLSMVRSLDTPLAMGFTIYSVTVVLLVMFVLDVLRAAVDPRTREGLLSK